MENGLNDISWVEEFPARKMDPEAFQGRTFREIFRGFAIRFMQSEDIAKALLIDKNDLDKRCIAVFGLDAKKACSFYAANSDREVRDVLFDLMAMGNASATKIYSEYVSGIAKEREANQNGIKVVVNVSREDGEDGDD